VEEGRDELAWPRQVRQATCRAQRRRCCPLAAPVRDGVGVDLRRRDDGRPAGRDARGRQKLTCHVRLNPPHHTTAITPPLDPCSHIQRPEIAGCLCDYCGLPRVLFVSAWFGFPNQKSNLPTPFLRVVARRRRAVALSLFGTFPDLRPAKFLGLSDRPGRARRRRCRRRPLGLLRTPPLRVTTVANWPARGPSRAPRAPPPPL
jgi:hypothetical protein